MHSTFALCQRFFPCVHAEYYNSHNKALPTVEKFNRIKDVAWEDPPAESASDQEKASYKERIEDLAWYVESWLPRCVDTEWYSASIRPRERMTSLVKVEGKMKPRVSSAREGYGFIQFENSRESWLAKFQWDDEQEEVHKLTGAKKKQAPNYSKKREKATKQFKSKWSDYASGSQCKWDPCVYAELELKQEMVREWRKADEAKNYKGQDLFVKLSQEKQGLTQEDLQPKATRSKKRSRANDGDEVSAPSIQPKSYGYRDD